MRTWFLIVGFIGGASGCMPHIGVNVLEPAAVAMPEHVISMAVLDRSRPSNVGQGILGTLEGVLTGEAIGADREGGREATQEVIQILDASPRFNAVRPSKSVKQSETNLFDREISWAVAKRICKQSGAQALVALEAFDTDSLYDEDSHQESYTDSEGQEKKRTVYTVNRVTQILTAWRVYDIKKQTILDELRDHTVSMSWAASGSTAGNARRALPSLFDAVVRLGGKAGKAYGERIAPHWNTIDRVYFASGDPMLVSTKRYINADDWEAAARAWRGLRESDDVKIRGKAAFNLALYHEVNGRLNKGIEWAKKSVVELGNQRTRNYLSALQHRLRERQRLREQMAPVQNP